MNWYEETLQHPNNEQGTERCSGATVPRFCVSVMTMSIAKLSADAGVKYLLRTTAHGDMNVRNLTDYYTKSGNPPGTWYGNGLGGIDLVRGAVLTDGAAKTVFETARHPFTGEPLGRPHGHRTIHAGKGPGRGHRPVPLWQALI